MMDLHPLESSQDNELSFLRNYLVQNPKYAACSEKKQQHHSKRDKWFDLAAILTSTVPLAGYDVGAIVASPTADSAGLNRVYQIPSSWFLSAIVGIKSVMSGKYYSSITAFFWNLIVQNSQKERLGNRKLFDEFSEKMNLDEKLMLKASRNPLEECLKIIEHFRDMKLEVI